MSNGETGWLRIYFEENAYTTVPATLSSTAAAILAPILRKKGLLNAATVNGIRHALFVTESLGESRSDSDDCLFERQLFDNEKPLEIQERMRKCGTIDQFKLTFRQVEQGAPKKDSMDRSSSAHDDVASQFAAAASASVNLEDSTDDADLISTPIHHSLASQSASFAASSRTLTSQPSLASLAVLSDPTIVRCGYLDKRGKRNTAWKERWFVIKPNGLHYYKSHAHTSPIATIPLTDAFVRSCHCSCQGRPTLPFVAAPSITNLTTSPPLPTPHAHSSLSKCSYEFEIHTIVRVFFLRARSYPEMLNWLRDLQGQIPMCLENQQLDEIADDIEQLEYMECEREEARLASLTNLASLLTDAIGLEQLVQFETERHKEKHVLAYLEAQGFARVCKMPSKSKSQLLERARTIYQEFFAPGSVQETVEVPLAERKKIQEAIQQGEPRPDLFEGVQTVLFEHLSEHSFPPFVHSKHFQRAMLKLSMVGAQGGVGNYQPSTGNSVAAPTTTVTQPVNNNSNSNNNANHHLRNASTFPSSVLADEAADLPAVTPSLASGGTAEMKSKGEEAGKDQVDVDESHSISALPVAGGGLLSSLYGVGSAAVGAVGALVPIVGASASPEILIPNSSPSPDSANTPLSNGKNMSPGSLASYLESIGEVDAKKRSASLVAANGPPNAKKDSSSANGSGSPLSTIPSSAASTTTGGDSDSDESEAEEHESEEEGMFGATPKVASSLLDSGDMPTSPTNGDRSSFTIPAQYQGKTNRGDNSLFGSTSSSTTSKTTSSKTTIISKSSVNDPLSSISSITIDEEDPLFVTSRSRSIEGAMKPIQSSTSTLGVIKELDVRATPSVSLNEGTNTRPRQADAGASFSGADGSDASPFAPSPQEVSSEPRVAVMEPQNPVEARRRSSALTHSAAPPPVQKAKAAAVVAAANSSSKWKKTKSIFDEDDDDEPGNNVAAAPASPFLSAKATAATAKPTTTSATSTTATSSTTTAKPASNTSSAAIDLAMLKEEAVDLGDLNLDEEPDMF